VPDLLKAAVLGVVQGLSEFLPISSTGHLIIAEEVLGVSQDEYGLRFDAAIHLGTLAAVLLYFRATLLALFLAWLGSLRHFNWRATPESRLAWLIFLGTLPAGVIGLAIESTAEDAFRDPALVGVTLILFSIPLVLAERYGAGEREVAEASVRDSLAVGFAQSVALIPGVSRSGITISTGRLFGFRREEAAAFAFLLSAPIIAAAGGKQVFDILRSEDGGGNHDYGLYAVGLVTAGVVGYASIAFLLRYLRTNSLYPFVAYRLVLGLLVLALVVAGVL
jgi:undecaprenyl-diphosphatase